jgi:hypothetical protein
LASGVWPDSATQGDVLYLDPDTAGALTTTEPTTPGDISKPMVICMSTSTGIVTGMRGTIVDSTNLASPQLYVREEQPNDTSAHGNATFTAGVWSTRVLNTLILNEITGASVSTNQITLPAGTYYIEGTAPAFFVSRHQTRVWNDTDSAEIVVGSSEYTQASGGGITTISSFSTKFTLGATKTIEIQHRCGTTKATNGFGIASNLGSTNEVFTQVRIWKVGN